MNEKDEDCHGIQSSSISPPIETSVNSCQILTSIEEPDFDDASPTTTHPSPTTPDDGSHSPLSSLDNDLVEAQRQKLKAEFDIIGKKELFANDLIYQRVSDRRRSLSNRLANQVSPETPRSTSKTPSHITTGTRSKDSSPDNDKSLTNLHSRQTKPAKPKRKRALHEVVQETPQAKKKRSAIVELPVSPESLRKFPGHQERRDGEEHTTKADSSTQCSVPRDICRTALPDVKKERSTSLDPIKGLTNVDDFQISKATNENDQHPSLDADLVLSKIAEEEEEPRHARSITDPDYLTHLDISQSIMTKTSLDQKRTPRGQPRVWSDSRQALCETVLYYQAWQGACYTSKGVLYSFMFDGNGHPRDLIDNDVVIARAGGAMVKDKATKQMIQSKDQSDNFQTQAVRTAISQKNPIVIFCGNQNTDMATLMPHRYCSLGWFKATHVWSEKTWNKKGEALENIRYRFEKLDPADIGWWTSESTVPISVGDFEPPKELECNKCHTKHQQVYLEAWMCLNTACEQFWTLSDGSAPEDARLNYDPRFIKQKTKWPCENPPYDLRPPLPEPAAQMGEDVIYAMTRGICCPHCGKCTSRFKWSGWICTNPNCHFEHMPRHTLITSASIRDPWHPTSYGYAQTHDWADEQRVSTSVEFSHNYRVVHYSIEGVRGRITHMIANQKVVEETSGPDDMFEALQGLDAKLERRRFTTGLEDFMTAFSSNTGMPYKFVASVDSESFEGAPWPLRETRSRLNWAARKVVGDMFTKQNEFNELLTIGYFDGQNVKYHDDGEKGLGATVASLSLGSPADMLFRVKSKHFTGVSKAGLLTKQRPIPGTNAYEARMAAWEQLQTDMSPISPAFKEKVRTFADQLDLKASCASRKPWIRLRLSHGDIVIMHGEAIQEYMEHQVEPMGRLRFAMTCRTILKEHLKEHELPSYEVKPDNGLYDGRRIAEMEG